MKSSSSNKSCGRNSQSIDFSRSLGYFGGDQNKDVTTKYLTGNDFGQYRKSAVYSYSLGKSAKCPVFDRIKNRWRLKICRFVGSSFFALSL